MRPRSIAVELEVKLPSLKETSHDPKAPDEATVSVYYVSEGEEVRKGEDLVEMVTDKAKFDVPCPATGVVKTLCKEEDDVVKVGEVLAILEVRDA
jgi:pyruvate/2-oxoglutarate dehydrogenase complex dihydrolipoamide acyltransferase (E2) component